MKKNLLRILLLFTVFTAVGCLGDDVDIENNRRILVKGKIIDPQGVPIPNISVLTSGFGDELGRTSSDSDGNFKLISLDEQFDPLDIFINYENFTNTQDFYSSLAYYSPEHTDRVLYDMGTIVLGKRATLNLILKNSSGTEDILNYEIKFTPSLCELPLNMTNPPENCDLSQNRSGSLSPSSENQPFYINSIQNSNVIFEYSINDGPTQTIEIPLTNEENTYVFEY